jgi:hypothetical protein
MDVKFEEFLRRGFEKPVPPAPKDRIREKVLAGGGPADPETARLARRSPWAVRWTRSHPRFLFAASFAALALLSLFGLVLLSSKSLPGDPLYGLKTQVESTRVMLAPASFEVRSSLALERSLELERLDRAGELDAAWARRLVLAMNDHLKSAHSLRADGRMEKLSEEAFNRTAAVLDRRGFAIDDPDFPMPLLFRRGEGLRHGFVHIPSFDLQPILWAEGDRLLLLIGGRLYKIDSKKMELIEEE